MTDVHSLFEQAIEQFDQANRQDPNLEENQGNLLPKEYLYSLRMSERLEKLYPQTSETLALAARAQHICRWRIPRSEFPEGRKGYHQWRKQLGQFHAEKAGEILSRIGYEVKIIQKVQALLRKEDRTTNTETQQLEDVACLVFIEHYLEDFVEKFDYSDEKVVGILQKTWKKISVNGQQAALSIPLSATLTTLIQKAVSS